MQKLIYTLLAVSVICSACKKEDENPILDANNTSSEITQVIVDKIWKGIVPSYQSNWNGGPNLSDIIFELSSNDSLYIYTTGCTSTKTSIGTWNISGKIITFDRVVNSIEDIGIDFGELTEYNETQLKFKIDTNTNAICDIFDLEIHNLSQSCTYIADYSFEQHLIFMGLDDIIDNYVLTSNINTLNNLDVSYSSISDLTGIEDFTALTYLNCSNNQLTSLNVRNNTALTALYCYDNQLTSLDVWQNPALVQLACNNNQLTSLNVRNNTALAYLNCTNNQLTSLDVRNGNNTNMFNGDFVIHTNASLSCIEVDDSVWSATYWFQVDFQHYFSTNNCQ